MPLKKDELETELKKKRLLEESEAAAISRNYRDHLRNLANANEADKDHNASVYRSDKENGEITLWQQAIQKADEALHTEVRAYDDWRAAMLGMLAMFTTLHDALHQSTNSQARSVAQLFVDTVIVDGAWNSLAKPLWNRAKPAFSSAHDEFAGIEKHVTFSDNDELLINPFFGSNENESGQTASGGRLEQLFKEGVIDWLADNGYKPTNTEQTQFKNDQNEQMTKRDFDDLIADPNRGLHHYLSNGPQQTATPSP